MMKMMARVLLMVMFVAAGGGLSGCGEPESEEESEQIPEFDIDEVDDALLMDALIAEAECKAGWACPGANRQTAWNLQDLGTGRFSSKEACVGIRVGRRLEEEPSLDHLAAFDEGRISVDRDRIDDCRAELEQRFCGSDPDYDVDMQTCMGQVGLFEVTQAEGDHCNYDFECGDELDCRLPPYDQCYGTCAPPDADEEELADGMIRCNGDGCDEETEFCKYVEGSHPEDIDGSCEAHLQEGDDCGAELNSHEQCAGQLVCHEWQCAEPGGEGESCIGGDCEEGLICYDDECVPPRQESDTCVHDSHCEGDLICPGIGQGECAYPTEQGGSCDRNDECEEGLTCRDDVCDGPRPEGEECNSGTWCEDGLHCIFGTCLSRSEEEEDCQRHSHCEPHLYCSPEGSCRAISVRQEGEGCGAAMNCEQEDVFGCHTGDICEPGTRCWGSEFDQIDDEPPAEVQGECVSVGTEGDGCLEHVDCADGYYCGNDGECRPLAGIGGDCDNHASCKEGFCDGEKGECVEPLEDGELCDQNIHCQGYCDIGWMNAIVDISTVGQIVGDGNCATRQPSQCEL